MIGLSTTQDVRRGAPLESVGRSVSMFGFVCVCVCVCLCVCECFERRERPFQPSGTVCLSTAGRELSTAGREGEPE